jgi:hypothetical protein
MDAGVTNELPEFPKNMKLNVEEQGDDLRWNRLWALVSTVLGLMNNPVPETSSDEPSQSGSNIPGPTMGKFEGTVSTVQIVWRILLKSDLVIVLQSPDSATPSAAVADGQNPLPRETSSVMLPERQEKHRELELNMIRPPMNGNRYPRHQPTRE